MLYDKISEAYLESIDTYRKVSSASLHSRQEKERWLGAIAFQMQIRRWQADEKLRTSKKLSAFRRDTSREILISKTELLDLLAGLIAEKTGPHIACEEARNFLDSIQRRSGLLLDRGEGLYGFTHLSFQEYFAARHLRQAVLSRKWQRDNEGVRPKDRSPESLFRLRQYAARKVWQETFVYLFESLSEDSDWPDELATMLKLAEEQKKLNIEALAALTTLAAALSVNPHLGFTHACRQQLWKNCLEISLMPRDWMENWSLLSISRQLFSRPHYTPQLVEFLRIITGEKQPKNIYLGGLTDLSPLSGLGSLQILNLYDCTGLCDLSPLVGLESLEHLYLEGSTMLTDLFPLSGLTKLQRLYLDGSTALADLSPLSTLNGLRILSLTRCIALRDVAPLSGLDNLQTLYLDRCISLTDLSPLSKFGNLETLHLSGSTALTDLSPLSGLGSLKKLHMNGCTALTDLSPVKHVPEVFKDDIPFEEIILSAP